MYYYAGEMRFPTLEDGSDDARSQRSGGSYSDDGGRSSGEGCHRCGSSGTKQIRLMGNFFLICSTCEAGRLRDMREHPEDYSDHGAQGQAGVHIAQVTF